MVVADSDTTPLPRRKGLGVSRGGVLGRGSKETTPGGVLTEVEEVQTGRKFTSEALITPPLPFGLT
jgi:hypothetical protein